MLYALLAYHEEDFVRSWSDEEDGALMAKLDGLHERMLEDGRIGPAARLGATALALTVRGKAVVTDGPFAETKEQLLGFYILDCETIEQAVETAQELKAANPSAIYEVRPLVLFRPGKAIPLTDQGLDVVRPPE
ncbi:YciI family protein [Phenylobacterium sp.]|uniref:YciI family protein n=1 Tax=Phenylobacterium sp. TaxID=1871053 RepID=UPI00356634E7